MQRVGGQLVPQRAVNETVGANTKGARFHVRASWANSAGHPMFLTDAIKAYRYIEIIRVLLQRCGSREASSSAAPSCGFIVEL
jgi:hypothetical protein